MTQLGLRRENACPRVYASGYTDGDIRGASVKESFVWIRLLICERDCDYRQETRGESSGSKFCVVIGLFYGAGMSGVDA